MTTPTALQHLDEHTQENVSAIDEALQRLEKVDKQQAQIVEMRYFGGLTIEQTAEALSISPATVKRGCSALGGIPFPTTSKRSVDAITLPG